LTTIIDLAGKKIVGWSISENMTTQNTKMKAWIDTRKTINSSDKFIFHTNIGVQYASNKMKNVCNFNLKITQSMSREDLKLRIKAKLLTK
jgi:transposase InsO family protein